MRIAIFSDNFYPEISGISDSIIALSKELVKRGHYVDFYVPYYSKKDYAAAGLQKKEIDLGKNVRIIRFFSIPYKSGTGQGRFVIPVGWYAFNMLRRPPDVIHTQLFFGVGLEAIFAARLLKKPVIGTNHTRLKEFTRYSPIKASWFYNLLFKYMNWYYERCELVTAPARSVIDEMVGAGFKMGYKKLGAQVVPNPIDIKIFNLVSLSQKNQWKKELDLLGPTIIYAGRFALEKRLDVMIEAFSIARKKIPSAILVLAGRGIIKDDLVEQAKKLGVYEAVKFVGVKSKAELVKYYGASDIFALSSTSEVQSITMLETMACGLPTVGVDVPGISEHVNESNGRLAKSNDPESLAEKMILFLENPYLQKQIGDGAVAFSKNFSVENVATSWLSFYEETIKRYKERNKIK